MSKFISEVPEGVSPARCERITDDLTHALFESGEDASTTELVSCLISLAFNLLVDTERETGERLEQDWFVNLWDQYNLIREARGRTLQ